MAASTDPDHMELGVAYFSWAPTPRPESAAEDSWEGHLDAIRMSRQPQDLRRLRKAVTKPSM